MKILHVITSLYTGGAERLMVDLLPRFREKGIEADLLLFDGQDTPFRREIESKGIKVMDFGVGGSVYDPKYIPQLRKIMTGYDIVHTHNTAPQFFVAVANNGLGKILITTEHNTHNRRRNWPGFSVIDRWMYRQYNTVICISDQAEENLRKFLKTNESNITTIYNGVDLSRFTEAVSSSELNTAPGAKKLIMVAAFRPQKDQQTLIRAMKNLPEDYHLYLVGEGECQNDCKELTKSLGLTDRAHFMGRRSDVGELLKSSDFVVMSSHYEGLSLSSVEGMGVGKPFIASDVDGLREVVKGYGVLFPHQDAEALAAEILRLDGDKKAYAETASRCGERARCFDISKMVDGYINIYNQLHRR